VKKEDIIYTLIRHGLRFYDRFLRSEIYIGNLLHSTIQINIMQLVDKYSIKIMYLGAEHCVVGSCGDCIEYIDTWFKKETTFPPFYNME